MARGPNQKAVAAAEKKAANQAVKDAEKARQNEAREAAEWKKGSNVRASNKAEEAGESSVGEHTDYCGIILKMFAKLLFSVDKSCKGRRGGTQKARKGRASGCRRSSDGLRQSSQI